MLRNLFTTLAIAISILIAATANAQNFLEEEAGICAYMNVGRAIDLTKAQTLYRTVENETEEYVVGSVPIEGYPESEDAHVYVHKDGWIAAYYLKDDPVAKIIDLKNYLGGEITGTKLDLALFAATGALNVPLTDVKYYDFAALDANRLLIIVDREEDDTTDSFKITIPTDLIVLERSWGFYSFNAAPSTFTINNEEILRFNSAGSDFGAISYGRLTPNQLRQGITHTVQIQHDRWSSGPDWSTGGLALVYIQP